MQKVSWYAASVSIHLIFLSVLQCIDTLLYLSSLNINHWKVTDERRSFQTEQFLLYYYYYCIKHYNEVVVKKKKNK